MTDLKHSDWKSIAVWALVALLSVVIYFNNKQFDTINSKMNAMNDKMDAIVQNSTERITRLETKAKTEEILLDILRRQCKD